MKHPETTSPSESYVYDSDMKKVTVRGASSFPEEIFELGADVEVLDMSFGQLDTIPEDIRRLSNLRIAFFSNNNFTSIPESLRGCNSLEMVGFKSCKIDSIPDDALPAGLRGLILTDNKITTLPRSIGNYHELQKLMLAGNYLEDIPEEIQDCTKLELLRLPLNRLAKTQDWLFELPSLAWYTDSGNPSSLEIKDVTIRDIRWHDLAMGRLLGQSSKNAVYESTLGNEQIAVKLFGDGITTDGAPADDMKASLLAGAHPNIIGAIGRISGAPDGRQGLVMPLITEDFHSLGQPPDFKSLTRDVFPPGMSLGPEHMHRILLGVAAAAKHLHVRGIMHGDIYAHNILVNDAGHSYLGDFGAASSYDPQTESAVKREHVDIRGFGYLIDDLLSLQKPSPDTTSPTDLTALRTACLDTNPAHRPSFKEILATLQQAA